MTTVAVTLCSPLLTCPSRGWSSLLVTHHGRKNRERGVSNQDAGHALNAFSERWLIGSIADGHGGDLHPRSSTGSRFAVNASNSEWMQVIHQRPELRHGTRELADAANSFPTYLCHRWRDAIDTFHKGQPWQLDELNSLSTEHRHELLEDPVVGYGSTLLSVAVHPTAILAAQLGDGAIVAVDQNGLADYLIQPVEQSIANATDSLCHHNAHFCFQTTCRPLAKSSSDMLMLTTDGYVNAFADSAGFLQVAHDYWRLWKNRGKRYLANHLHQWIADATDSTSYDDATLILLFREPHRKGLWI